MVAAVAVVVVVVQETNLVSKFIALKRTNRDINTYEESNTVPILQVYIFK
jgi:hypothetical protein